MSGFEKTLGFDEVNVGDCLPELSIPLSATRIIATAIASRDYQDVHHDLELAQERGTKSIFMNILTTVTCSTHSEQQFPLCLHPLSHFPIDS